MSHRARTRTGTRTAPPESTQANPPILPGPKPAAFPIVGIGASAGGLAAFEAFFTGMPAAGDPGMAFVLVQHLAPDHKSLLAELIRRYTRMTVYEVEDGMTVQVNCVYIIPPGRDMALLAGSLHLLQPAAPRGQRLPIDFFFLSLAQDQRERSIAVVLAGTGCDGTLGVRAIKAEGGMVMAQTCASTEFGGMPQSALATGLVDYELPPAEMPARLIAYCVQAYRQSGHPVAVPSPIHEQELKKVLILVRAQTGHDFTLYKPSTINRRIERRMAVHQVGSLADYVAFLQQTPAEVAALFRDLLIGVTSFFRDPEVFQALAEQIITPLLASRPAGAVVRVWSSGCSTGEEAYSLAIVLQECLEAARKPLTVQIFATDLDSRAVASARRGCYPLSIAADLTPDRLARFFAAGPDGSTYRINKGIRDLVVFSEQNLIRDPPFSHLDLLMCRNLFIYLGGEAQRKLLPLFHYALNPGGVLVLGTSESVGEAEDQFLALDRRLKIYRSREDGSALPPVKPAASPTSMAASGALPASAAVNALIPSRFPLRDLTEQALLQHLGTVAVLVDGKGDILYLHGRGGAYLEPAQGQPGSSNILKMAREGLASDLAAALHKAVGTNALVRAPALHVLAGSERLTVDVTIRPLPTGSVAAGAHLYLVICEETHPAGASPAPPPAPSSTGQAPAGPEDRIAILQQELRAKDEHLQASHEELQSSTEELRSANEEMQSVNEELQSANEELETSKEEQQSVNEELATVNGELQSKMADYARANNDMANMLSGSGIATIFVDPSLRILRFTASASEIVNLIASDRGRPLAHLATRLVGYSSLVADTQAVLDTLMPRDQEVQTTAERWYSLRLQAYRTLDNVIEGVAITFLDITEMVRVREALRRANDLQRLALGARDARDAVIVQDLDGRILAWNPGAVRLYGWSEGEALLLEAGARIPAELRAGSLAALRQSGLADTLQPLRSGRLAKDGSLLEVSLVASPLVDDAGRLYALASTERRCQPAVPAAQEGLR